MDPTRLLAFARDPKFWRGVVPELTVGGDGGGGGARAMEATRSVAVAELARARERLHTEGYFALPEVLARDDMARLARALTTLTSQGWPTPFLFLYDEPWQIFERLAPVLTALLGADYRRLAAFWAWRIEPSARGRGWPPHRDHKEVTIDAEGVPNVVTLWIAVTEATPENGCIYVLPASRDPSYHGDLDAGVAPTSVQDVRALPARAGTVLGWSHHLLHWGGRATSDAECPRMSFSAEFERAGVAPIDEAIARAGAPSFEERLALVGRQLLRYEHLAGATAPLRALAEALTHG